MGDEFDDDDIYSDLFDDDDTTKSKSNMFGTATKFASTSLSKFKMLTSSASTSVAFPENMCGHWADGLRCFRLFNEQQFGSSQFGRVESVCSVYGTSTISSIHIDSTTNTVRFVENGISRTAASPIPTSWKLTLLDSQIVLCPSNHHHNMELIPCGQIDPYELKQGTSFTGWHCDVCKISSNPHQKTPPPKCVERFFCGLCLADICISCASARKQYNQTLNGTAESSSLKSLESLTLIPTSQVNDYCTALSRQQNDVIVQLRVKACQRSAKQSSAYTAATLAAQADTITNNGNANGDSSSGGNGGRGSRGGRGGRGGLGNSSDFNDFNGDRGSRGGFGGRRGSSRGGFGSRSVAMMLLASSGRHNFRDLSLPDKLLAAAEPHDSTLCTSRASMCAMLMLEAKLRQSTSVQRLLTDFPEVGEIIFSSLQYKVAKTIGFKDPNLGRLAIRAAATLFPGDTELLHLASYRKFNRSGPCTLSIGDQFPDLPLYALEKENEKNVNNGDAKDAKDAKDANENLKDKQSFLPTLLPISKHHERLLNISNNTTNNNS